MAKKTVSQNCSRLYVLESDNNKRVKIGITNNPLRRIKQLQESGGFILENYYVTEPIEYARELELLIHSILRQYRVTGEWFEHPFYETVFLVRSVVASIFVSIETKAIPLTHTIHEAEMSTKSVEKDIHNMEMILAQRERFIDEAKYSANGNLDLTWGEIIEIQSREKEKTS